MTVDDEVDIDEHTFSVNCIIYYYNIYDSGCNVSSM